MHTYVRLYTPVYVIYMQIYIRKVHILLSTWRCSAGSVFVCVQVQIYVSIHILICI